jgi:hypothetical protein
VNIRGIPFRNWKISSQAAACASSIARHSLGCLLVAFGCMGVLAPVSAQTDGKNGGWNFALSPYVWVTSMQGNTSIGPISADIDMGFDDTLSDLRMALMLNFRAENGPWAIQADGVWADLESNTTSGIVSTDVGTTLWVAALNGRYRVADNWEFLAGARYFRQDIDINLLVGSIPLRASSTVDWIDPVIGAKFATALSDKWFFGVQGDIGGFGVGSQFTWQAWANFEYRFAKSSSLALGWRHLDWDYEEGGGVTKVSYDAYLTGPVVGLRFRF